jgi:hypothetical protein
MQFHPFRILLLLAVMVIFSGCKTGNTSGPQSSSGVGLAALFGDNSGRHRFLYLLEHRALPEIWLNSATPFTDDIKARGRTALVDLMKSVATKCDYEVSEEDLAAIDIEYHEWAGGVPGWVVTFPKPRVMPESSYAAMLYDGETLRFYCLEFDDMTGQTMWFLCGWSDKAHLNFGTRLGHSKEDFIRYVGEMLEKNHAPEATTVIPGRE